MATMSQCLRALKVRGYTQVRAPAIDGEPDFVLDIENAIELSAPHLSGPPGGPYEYTLIGDSIWMLPIDPVHSEPYWIGVALAPPASRPTVWERLLAEEVSP